jgi:hypothetical protein
MQKNKPNITLIKLLAYQRTPQLRAILKKYGKEDAKNLSDLELKIAELYANSDDKLTLEKEFAEIHPHKSFVLKHLAPKEKSIDEIKEEMLKFANEETSNCEGNPNCKCKEKKSNACGCGMSSADGVNDNSSDFNPSNFKHWIGPIALAGTIVVGMWLSFRLVKKMN